MTGLGLAAALPFNQTKGDPLLSLGPVFAIRAKDSVEGEQWALNQGTGGQVLRARYGSVGRAEIRRGVGAIFPGSSGNYISIPLASPTDIDIVARIFNYTPSTDYSMGQFGSNMSWGVFHDSGNLIGIVTKDSGGSVAVPLAVTRGTRPDIVSGAFFWVRIRRVSSTGMWTIELQPDGPMPSSWGMVHSNVAGPTGALTGSSVNQLGQGGNPYTGIIAYYQHATTIGGAPVYIIDFTQQNDFTTSFTCTTGQTVTVTAANAVDTNDPYLLAFNGNDYVYFPGITGNIITATWSTSAFTSCSWRMRVKLDALPGSIIAIAGADSTYGTVQIDTIGRIVVGHRDAAANLIGGQWSSIAVPSLISNDIWLRCDLNTTTAECSYYYSLDNTNIETAVTWIQVGTVVTGAFAGNIPNPKSNILFGSNSVGIAGHPIKFYAGAFYTNGTCKVSWRMDNKIPTLVTGDSLTINRSTSGKKTVVVNQSCWSLGTDDYLEVADNDLLDFDADDPYTIIAVTRVWGTPPTSAVLAKKNFNGITPGYSLHVESVNWYNSPSDGTAYPHSGYGVATVSGALKVYSGVRDVVADRIRIYDNNTTQSVTDTMTNTLANSSSLRVGAWATSGYYDGEIFAVYIFRKALTAAEIAAGVQYYGAA